MAPSYWQLSFVLWLALTACAASNPGSPTGGNASGGALSSGGVGGASGTMPTGGVVAAGGNTGGVGSGGVTAIGGSVATGGVSATGGAAGGIPSTGGRTGTGGARTGGTNATGGVATGGQSNTSTRATGGSATGGSSATGGATSPGLTAAQAASAMGKGVNIGQTFESTQNERTLAAVSAKIDAYYAKGFRNVRIPITWTEPVGGDRLVGSATVGDVNRSHARLAVINQVVDYALAKPGLYVIINAHHETGLKTNSRAAVLERLWADIADIFAAKDHRLLFELLNEPHRSDGSNSPMPAADLRAMSSWPMRRSAPSIPSASCSSAATSGSPPPRWRACGPTCRVWATARIPT